MDLAAKRVRKRGGPMVERWWPGGRRGGRILRFAEADKASASASRLCAFNTALARKGAGRIQSLRAFRLASIIEKGHWM